MHFLFYLSNSSHHLQRVWKHRQRKTPGPLWTVNWWMCLSKTLPLMLLSGFPKESLIHCWFDLLLWCVPASEQCVKTGYLPCSVGEGENWAASRRPGQTPCCHKSTKSPSTARLFSFCLPSLSLSFTLCLSFFISKALFWCPFSSIFPPLFFSLVLLLSPGLLFFVSRPANIMSTCGARPKRVSFGCLLLWLTKELRIPWFGHYFMQSN